MNKRLFIALPIATPFLKVFLKYRDQNGRATPWARWTAVSNMHVTVLFLGDIQERDIARIQDALSAVCEKTRTFMLSLKRVIYAPPDRPPRMIWALYDGNASYTKLVTECARALKGRDICIEDSFGKEKVPHLTLARFKRRALPRELIRLKHTGLEGEAMPVQEVLLMESKLTPHGAAYKTLERFTLP